ncbi:FAS1 domain-containing protein [Xylariaceae sp. FL1651]|nr:FAS1 domain-containing protein [Xylariaceae sp. FL1651]
MRYTTFLPLAAVVAKAIVIPDEAMAQQLVLDVEKTVSGLWEGLWSTAEETLSAIGEGTHKLLDNLSEFDILDSLLDTDSDVDDTNDMFDISRPGYHGKTNLTMYQAIKASNFTRKFAAIIDDIPDLVDMLNSTKSNVTVFVPIDKAFEKIPEHDHKPSKEFVQKVMEYHILPGYYPAGRVLGHHTLPTALKSAELGGRPQRLRVSVGLFGLKMNFYSKVVMSNFFAANGVAHGVNSILVPPPPAGRILSLLPSKFSTLLLAVEKTGLAHLGHEHGRHGKHDDTTHKQKTGLTLFAPTNLAFRKLGPAANAFLFNTEKGLGYLRALLKYHVVVNETLYSDAYYGLKGHSEDLTSVLQLDDNLEQDGVKGGKHNGHFHIDLPTALGDKSLSIDIARWYGFINMRINGHIDVAIQDGIAQDGVLQVLNSVLIPPREPKRDGAWTEDEHGWISVEELVERLQPYVEEERIGGEKMSIDIGKEQLWSEL